MAGQTGADQRRPGLRDDPHRRISRLLKDSPVALPVRRLPSCRAADIDNIVVSRHQHPAADQLRKDAGRKGADVLHTLGIAQKAALKAHSPCDRVRAVAGALPDQKSPVGKARVSSDEALRVTNLQNHRLFCPCVPVRPRDSALRVSEVKSVKSFHTVSCRFPGLLP